MEQNYTATRDRLARALNRSDVYRFVPLSHAHLDQFAHFAQADQYDWVKAQSWNVQEFKKAHGGNVGGLVDQLVRNAESQGQHRFLVQSKSGAYNGEVVVAVDREQDRLLVHARMRPSKQALEKQRDGSSESIYGNVIQSLSKAARELGVRAIEFEELEPVALQPRTGIESLGVSESQWSGGQDFQVHRYRFDCKQQAAARGAA